MANLFKLREKETERFITETICGLKAIRREVKKVIAEIKYLDEEIKGGDNVEKDS